MDSNEMLQEELRIALESIESQMDPDDGEIQAYARAMNRVQGDEDAINARYKAELAKLDANRAKMLKACENRRKGIDWKWGRMIKDLVFQKTHGTRKRFVDTLFGRVGFRKQPAKTKRIFRDGCDKNTALEWAKENCPGAVSSRTTDNVLLGELPADCPQIWVEEEPEHDAFYFKPPKKSKEKANE